MGRYRYAACYSSVIYPANGQSLWERTKYNDLQPPSIRKQPGRPKKKRNKEAHELLKDDAQMKRARWGMKCRKCKQSGHNKATCNLPPPPQPPTSQPPPQPPTSKQTAPRIARTQPTGQRNAANPTDQGAQTTQVNVQGTLILKVLQLRGKGRENSRCLQHSLKVQMPRKKDLLLELRVLFQPSTRHLFMMCLFGLCNVYISCL